MSGVTMSEQQVLPELVVKQCPAIDGAGWCCQKFEHHSGDHQGGYAKDVIWASPAPTEDKDATIAALRASLAQSEAERERLQGERAEEVEKLKSRRVHTQEWYASHYAKLQEWARKILPEPWRNQFFSCIANGTYDHTLDVGEAYICKAGFKVVPSGYIHMDTAEGQIIRDQTTRAEEAEIELARERELNQGLRHTNAP